MSFLDVSSPNCAGQSVGDFISLFGHIFYSRERYDSEHWAKYLFLSDSHVIVHARENGWLYVIAFGQITFWCIATTGKLGTFLLSDADVIQDSFLLFTRYLRANLSVFVQTWPLENFSCAFSQLGQELIVD